MILEAGFLDDATWDLSATIVCIYILFTAMNGSNIYMYIDIDISACTNRTEPLMAV